MDPGREGYTPTQSGRRAPLINSGIIIFASVFYSLVIHVVPKVGAESPYQIRYADPTQQSWRVSRYRELEGHGVRCVTEGEQGAMWFGLHNGAVKYDGYHWQFYDTDDGLPEGSVEWLETRRDSSIVAATKSGLYQLTDQQWNPLFSSAQESFPAISFVTETSDSALWSACEWGLIRFRDRRTTIFTSQQYARIIRREELFDDVIVLPDECLPSARFHRGTGIAVLGRSVVALASDSAARAAGLRVDDRILDVNGESRALFRNLQRESGDAVKLVVERFDSGTVETIEFTALDTEGRFQYPAIHSVTEDSQNRIWVGAKNGSVFLSPDGGSNWVKPPGNEELVVKQRPFVMELSNGDIMVVSAGRNATVCRFNGKTWSRKTISMLSGADYVSVAAETFDGTIWLGGLNRLYVYHDGEWRKHDTRDLRFPSESHRMCVASDQSIWIVGFGQCAVRIGMSQSEYLSLQGARYECTDNANAEWFIGADKRIIRKDQHGTIAYNPEDGVIESPTAIFPAANGVIAIGQHQQVASLSEFDGRRWSRIDFPKVAAEFSGQGFEVAEDGSVWVAATGKRLKRDQNGGLVVRRNGTWKHLPPPGPPPYATSIRQLTNGKMMFGGGFGIIFFDGKDWIQASHPLLQDTPCPDIAVDEDGTAWVATRTQGILRFRDGQWDQFTTDQGVPSYSVDTIGVGLLNDVWASTAEGLCRFDGTRFQLVDLPHALGRESIKPGTNGSIWLDGKHRIQRDTDPPMVVLDTRELTVEYGGKSLLQWRGVDKWNRSDSDDLLWSTCVDGGPWSEFRRDRQFVLDEIPAGFHQIEVRGRDEDLNEYQSAQPINLTVIPPFWKRAWFVIPTVVVLLILGWLSFSLIKRGIVLSRAIYQLELARKQLANQFEEKSAQFRAVCDCSPIGIFVSDTTARVSYANRYLTRILKDADQSDVGEQWTSALHPDDRERIIDAWQKTTSQRKPFRDHGRFLHPNGKVIWFEVAADCIERNGEPHSYVGAVEDVTARIHANNDLRESNHKLVQTLKRLKHAQDHAIKRERLGALGQMAAGVAHDINNSLSPLLTYSELLASEASVSDCGRHWAELIRVGVSDMSDTVKRLDHFYRQSHHRDALETVDLLDLAKQAAEMTRPKWENAATADGKCIDLQVSSTSTPVVNAVPSQIRAALMNLIFNAVDAIDDQGVVHIRVSEEYQTAVLEVHDNGPGMSKAQLDRCLEPFFTSKAKGSGLGLSECHGVVRQHGGKLQIESETGRGTRVRIRLPREQSVDIVQNEPSSSPSDKQATSVAPPQNIRVLYIDDDDMVQSSTAALLQTIGVDVEIAGDGPTGLSKLEESEFDLVICDHGLPGMNGAAVLETIKSQWPDLPVVIVSGWTRPIAGDAVQPDAFLEKPVSADDLIDVVNTHARTRLLCDSESTSSLPNTSAS